MFFTGRVCASGNNWRDQILVTSFLNISWYMVQLEGPDPWYNQVGPTKVGARKSFLFIESSCVAIALKK